MGIGLGLYVNRNGGAPGGVSYIDYLAPALLVTQAMMAAAFESAWPIMGKIEWDKTYIAALNTPVRCRRPARRRSHLDRLSGVAPVGAVPGRDRGARGRPRRRWSLLAVPVAILTALAFAAPIMAFTATQTGR